MRGLFVTGTDTGCGKTFVTAALARLLRRQGRAVCVCKPVATGAEWRDGRLIADDTLLLAEAGERADLDAVTPWAFAEPAAPPVAARAAGTVLHLDEIVAAVRRRAAGAEVLLVEGVGGLLCPLTDEATVADLAAALGLPLLIVARRSLGTLNHTLLTLEAARGRGLRVAGVVVSETAPPAGLAERTNVDELRRLGVPVLAVLPYGDDGTALTGWLGASLTFREAPRET
jgi:dethiobiotin synthetase